MSASGLTGMMYLITEGVRAFVAAEGYTEDAVQTLKNEIFEHMLLSGSLKAVKLLLKAGCEVFTSHLCKCISEGEATSFGRIEGTPEGIKQLRVSLLRSLLQAKANPNLMYGCGNPKCDDPKCKHLQSPLSFCVLTKRIECVPVLLEHGAWLLSTKAMDVLSQRLMSDGWTDVELAANKVLAALLSDACKDSLAAWKNQQDADRRPPAADAEDDDDDDATVLESEDDEPPECLDVSKQQLALRKAVVAGDLEQVRARIEDHGCSPRHEGGPKSPLEIAKAMMKDPKKKEVGAKIYELLSDVVERPARSRPPCSTATRRTFVSGA